MRKNNLISRSLSSSDVLSGHIFHIEGSDTCAPSVYIQSCIHGSEVQGYLVCLYLLEHFHKNPPKGSLSIVPLCNPYATNLKIGEYSFARFDSTTGDNWNRNYKNMGECVDFFLQNTPPSSFEEAIPLFKRVMRQNLERELQSMGAYHRKLALSIQSHAVLADIVLDLHCDTISKPHIYGASYLMDSVLDFHIPYIIEIPHLFSGALDEACFCPWIELFEHYKANDSCLSLDRPPFESFTLELGNQEFIDKEACQEIAHKIIHYLSCRGVCDDVDLKKIHSITTCGLDDFVTLYASLGGLIVSTHPLGVPCDRGGALLSLSNMDHFSKDFDVEKSLIHLSIEDSCIPLTHISSSIVHEGMPLMKIMKNYSVVSNYS